MVGLGQCEDETLWWWRPAHGDGLTVPPRRHHVVAWTGGRSPHPQRSHVNLHLAYLARRSIGLGSGRECRVRVRLLLVCGSAQLHVSAQPWHSPRCTRPMTSYGREPTQPDLGQCPLSELKSCLVPDQSPVSSAVFGVGSVPSAHASARIHASACPRGSWNHTRADSRYDNRRLDEFDPTTVDSMGEYYTA